MDVAQKQQGYASVIEALLPPGRWRAALGPNMKALLGAIAALAAEADERVAQMLREQRPRTINETLGDWERVLGLPDGCTAPSNTVNERRAAIVTRLLGRGGVSKAALIELAANAGFVITVDDFEEFEVFRCGKSVMGDRLYSTKQGWSVTFRVHAPVWTANFWRCGASACNDPLTTFSNGALECAFRRAKHAHTRVLFAYDRPPQPADVQPWGQYVIPEPIDIDVEVLPFQIELM